MHIRGIGRLRRWGKRLWLKTQQRALILTYHRIAEIASDPQLLCVSPEHFAQHLQILQRDYHPLSLQDLRQQLIQANVPHKAVVVTFDDGYADNLYQAKPLLTRYRIPATVFVTAGMFTRPFGVWGDMLEQIFLQPGELPPILSVHLNGQSYSWPLGSAARYDDPTYRRHAAWNVLEPSDPTQRHTLYRTLHRLLKPLSAEHRDKALLDLITWAGISGQGRQSHRLCTMEEIKQLANRELIDIGAHTMTHPVLSACSREQQRTEIQQSKVVLEQLLKQPVISFAYPYGTQHDYTLDTLTLVREAGYACACANFADCVVSKTDRFQLPRVVVRDWSPEYFARQVKDWFCE